MPFFVVEYLDALSASGLERDAEWSVPVGVRDLLRSRLSTASEIAAQILTAAAAIGRSFDFETVRDASGRGDEETVAALEELIGKGIVVEQDGSYDFRQRQMRSLVYDETSLARRRIVHRCVAEAGDELGLAQAHNMLGILAGGRGDRAGAQRHLEESLRLASESAYPGPRVAALNNLALAYTSRLLTVETAISSRPSS